MRPIYGIAETRNQIIKFRTSKGRFSPVYIQIFKGKLLPSASSECVVEPCQPSIHNTYWRDRLQCRRWHRLILASLSGSWSLRWVRRCRFFSQHDSNSHTSLAGLHKFRDGRVRSSRCFSWIAFAARRYYPSLRQHVSSKVNTFWMYCFPYSTVSPTTWSVVTHEHGCRGVIMRCNLQQGHVLTHSLHHKPGQGRTILNIRDVISALGDVDLCVVQVLRNVGAFEVPFAHALPPRLQLRRLPKVSSNF